MKKMTEMIIDGSTTWNEEEFEQLLQEVIDEKK